MSTFKPSPPPSDPKLLGGWLQREFASLRSALERAWTSITYEYLHAEPAKLVKGMEVLADGTDWDPGGIGVAAKYRRSEDNLTWELIEAIGVADALAAHLADTVDAHDASAISNVAAGTIAATNVQAALNELDTEKVPATRTVNGQALSANVTVTASDVGLGSVTNDAQTKAAIVPNTIPSAGQLLAGNAGGTAYAPVSASGDATVASTGAITIANDAVTYAKMQNVSAASKLLGRGDSGSGDVQEITLGAGLAMTGTTVAVDATAWTTFTPSVAATTPGGTPPTFGTVVGRYKMLTGKSLAISYSIPIPANGTGSVAIAVSIPAGMTAASEQSIPGEGAAVSGKTLKARIVAAASVFGITNYDNTYPGADGERLIVTGVIEIA